MVTWKRKRTLENEPSISTVWEVLLLFLNKWRFGIAPVCGARGCRAGMIPWDLFHLGGLRSGIFPSLSRRALLSLSVFSRRMRICSWIRWSLLPSVNVWLYLL